MATAVIVRARLPAGLEALRRRSVDDAADGIPAHLTLLYPFVDPPELGPSTRSSLLAIARAHAPFSYELAHRAAWPDTIYVAVDPVEPFVRLQSDLARAFPDYPIYGRGPDFVFIPHVTIAEGAAVDDPTVTNAAAWSNLPVTRWAAALEVITDDADGRWRTRWRIGLGGSASR